MYIFTYIKTNRFFDVKFVITNIFNKYKTTISQSYLYKIIKTKFSYKKIYTKKIPSMVRYEAQKKEFANKIAEIKKNGRP